MNASQKDTQLVQRLIASTLDGKLKWQPTAADAQYSASFKGKWTVFVDEYYTNKFPSDWTVSIQDADGREMLRITDNEFAAVRQLYEAARRSALNVDEAIDDILNELDIPF